MRVVADGRVNGMPRLREGARRSEPDAVGEEHPVMSTTFLDVIGRAS
jgi:hypothetical protein